MVVQNSMVDQWELSLLVCLPGKAEERSLLTRNERRGERERGVFVAIKGGKEIMYVACRGGGRDG